MKIVMVTIVTETENGERDALRISGSDADKWADAIESSSCHYYEKSMFNIHNITWGKI